MSHFTVGVITKNSPDTTQGQQELNALLAPFEEQTENEKYLVFEEDVDSDFDDKAGKNGYWYNPKSKWDWYVIGGRWGGLLKTLDGQSVDYEQIKNIDRTMDEDAYQKAARYWEVVVEHSPLKQGEDKSQFFNMYRESYYINQYGTKEAYATEKASFSMFAILSPDGQWAEQGEMGWFGMSSATNDSKAEFIQSMNNALDQYPEHYLTVVDCHI